MSEHLSEPFIEKHPYQLSYVMLIERSINLSLIVYVDAIVNQAEYLRNKSRKVREFVYARILSCFPMSSTLYCYVNAKNIFKKKKFMFNCRSRFRQSISEV